MFNHISWQGYWTTIALLTTTYYLVICLLFYRSAFYEWMQGLQHKSTKVNPSTSVPFLQKQEQTDGVQQPSLFEEDSSLNDLEQRPDTSETDIVNSFADELDAFLQEAKLAGWVKEEMMYALQRLLKKYPALKGAAYKEALTGLLAERCQQICSIHLEEAEREQVWM